MFERLLADLIKAKFDDSLSDGLNAYRKGNSCETTLLGLVEDWKLAKDNQLFLGILSTEMAQAFYSLHPPLMLRKLKTYGYHDVALNLLRGYLCSRLGRVHSGSVASTWRNMFLLVRDFS